MSTRPRTDSLDRLDLAELADMVIARAYGIPREQHALMSAYGGPPQSRSCHITATGGVSFRVPPGVTECDLEALIAVEGTNDDCRIGFTTAADAVGTEFNLVGGDDSDVSAAAWRETGGALDDSVGAHSGRALTVLAAAAWEETDVDVTVTITTATSSVIVFGLVFKPVHVPR